MPHHRTSAAQRIRILGRGLLLLACLSVTLEVRAADPFKVVVSIKPIHSLVAGLMQGIEPPSLLIGEGRNPYDYELSEPQRRLLEQADLLIWVGPELEASLQQPIAELPDRVEVVELLAAPDLKILPSRRDDARRNPYFWLDNRNALLLLDDLTRLLERLDPLRSHVYARNREQLLQRLARLDREFEYGYRGLNAGVAAAYYDTQYYFEQAYALTVLDRVLESPRDPLDAAALLRVRQRLQDGEAACLLTERGLPAPHLALLTDAGRVDVVELDSLGSRFPAGPDLYFELMRHNNAAIRRCLKAPPLHASAVPDDPVASFEPDPGIGGGRFMLTDQYGRLVTPGRNTISISVAPMNILAELEPIYLLGTFSLDARPRGWRIGPPEELGIGSWKSQGMPFYSDKVIYGKSYDIEKEPGQEYLVVLGEWSGTLAEVRVNGERAGIIGWQPYELDITSSLENGLNKVEVVVVGSLKNLLGPLHTPWQRGIVTIGDFQQGPEEQPSGSEYDTFEYGLMEDFLLIGQGIGTR